MNFDEYNPYTTVEQNNLTGTEPEKPKKKKGKVKKVLTSIGCAVLLGSIAGGACYGVSYAGYTFFPIESKTSETQGNQNTNNNQTMTPTKVDTSQIKTEISATVMDVSDIVDSVISSVVAISGTYTSNQYGIFGSQQIQSTVSGSGIIIGQNDEELLIVTNAHVVENISEPTVCFYDGTELKAVMKGSKASSDLAVIAIKKADIPSGAIYSIAKMGESEKLRVGEAAIAIGNSLGYGISVTTGCISALNKSVTVENVEYKDLIQTDAAINPGNSGGALFNAYGEVIGINSVKTSKTGVEGMGYAISISSVKEIIDSLSTMKNLSDEERGYLGVTGVTISEDINRQYGYPVGILVRTVEENSAAYNAGIVKNDIIFSFDGEKLETFDQLYSMMSSYEVGQQVEVGYYHMSNNGEYEEKTVTVTLTAKNN